MSYVATALFRNGADWSVEDADLSDVEDVDMVVDVLRDIDPNAKTAVLLVEQDDEYVAIVRVDGDDEPRVFVSDGRAADAFPLVEAITSGVDIDAGVSGAGSPGDADDESEEVDDDPPPGHDMAPAGDASVLADFGTPAKQLLDMCAHEHTLPGDVIAAVIENAGALEEYEGLRG